MQLQLHFHLRAVSDSNSYVNLVYTAQRGVPCSADSEITYSHSALEFPILIPTWHSIAQHSTAGFPQHYQEYYVPMPQADLHVINHHKNNL